MSSHSVLFGTSVDREDHSRTTTPALHLESSRRSSLSSPMLRSSNAYWPEDHGHPSSHSGRTGGRDYSYPQYTSPLDTTIPTPSRSPTDYGRHSESANPPIDLSSLIPMYGEPGSPEMDSRGQLLDLSYSNDWQTSSISQYPSTTYQRNKSALWQSSSDGAQHWSPSLQGGSLLAQHFNEYVPSSPYSSTTSSSSPSPSYFLTPSTTPGMSSGPSSSRRRGGNNEQGTPKKSCFHCHVTSTPLWRREPSTQRPLCNACGLYLQQRNKLRPQELIDADIDDDDTPQIPDEEYTGPKCSHCLTRQTSVWRRSKTGAQVCNACGVYARLRGKERPLSLRRNKIKPRTKHSR
ncbi:GATA zinc finger domain-containing protein [Mycena venus]|uniref:GATA zinc finger domain-containing protein n=1 Tax=Mycena venus TaxID=2733690 RepID=A0A8H6YRD6_9AGAR|nr:GATA zinc finger domain-containing protein [Mycena venus]